MITDLGPPTTTTLTAVSATLTGTGGRYVGETNGAPPTGAPYLANDFANDPANGCFWLYDGTTWKRVGAAPTYAHAFGSMTNHQTSGTASEFDSTMRLTVAAGATGHALVRQAITWETYTGGNPTIDSYIHSSTDNATWNNVAGYPWNPLTGPFQTTGEYLYTGLTPGQSYTFYMGWGVGGTGTVYYVPASRGAAYVGTWHSVYSW